MPDHDGLLQQVGLSVARALEQVVCFAQGQLLLRQRADVKVVDLTQEILRLHHHRLVARSSRELHVLADLTRDQALQSKRVRLPTQVHLRLHVLADVLCMPQR
eukprot:766226-Hanusia_phi.AAC.2